MGGKAPQQASTSSSSSSGADLNTPYQAPPTSKPGTRAPYPGEVDVRGPESHVYAQEDATGTSANIAQAGLIVSNLMPGMGAINGLGQLSIPDPTSAGGPNGFSFGGTGGGVGAGGPSDVTTAINNQTMQNRPNQDSPFGSTRWTVGPDGRPVQTTSLAPGLEGTSQSLQEQARINALRGVGTGEEARNQAIQGAYDQASSRLNPQWAQRDEALAGTLANQGLDPSSQAYRNAMLQQSQQRNDAYSGAMNGAIAQGTAAGSAIFNQNLQAQQLPYDQMQAMYGLSQPFGFNGAASPNVLGQNQLDASQAAEARRIAADAESAKWSAAGKGIGAAGGFIKDNWGNWVKPDGSPVTDDDWYQSDQEWVDSGWS